METNVTQGDPRSGNHEEFLELCAASVSEGLSRQEEIRLSEHLRRCQVCRKRCEEYRVIHGDVVRLTADKYTETADQVASVSKDDRKRMLDRLLADCRSKAGVDELESDDSLQQFSELPGRIAVPQFQWLTSSRAMSLAAALVIAASIFVGGYRFGRVRGEAPQKTTQEPQISLEAKLSAATAQLEAQRQIIDANNVREADLISRIADMQKRSDALQGSKALLQQNADKARVEEQRMREKLARANDSAVGMDRELDSLRQQLESLREQRNADTVRAASLELQVQQLRDQLAGKDREAAQFRDWLNADRDIRDLMGARDLVITEVHDVVRNGKTQKPFARVFYTKGKSLVFYAYDLDQQPGVKNATFQAWGVHGADDKHAVDLGILYSDNDAGKRWILKFDDPKTLAQIDAVFVTTEPNGGSRAPSGKQLLFAYLGTRPNHP